MLFLQVLFDDIGCQSVVLASPAVLSLIAHASAHPGVSANLAGEDLEEQNSE